MANLKVSASNKQAREEFVDFWGTYVRTHPDQEWGKQHTKLINAMLLNAKQFPLSAEQYLQLKGEPYAHKNK